MGERLNHLIALPAYRAASVLLLLVPETPLLFMGQEWASSSPFQYFTHHNPELGRKVTEGRRREFARFASFGDPAARERIPDPQAQATFVRSKLIWEEIGSGPHAEILRLYRTLLNLRTQHPAMADWHRGGFEVSSMGEDALLLLRKAGDHRLLAAIQLRNGGSHELSPETVAGFPTGAVWQLVLTTEDAEFANDRVAINFEPGSMRVEFMRPGAVILATSNGARGGQ